MPDPQPLAFCSSPTLDPISASRHCKHKCTARQVVTGMHPISHLGGCTTYHSHGCHTAQLILITRKVGRHLPTACLMDTHRRPYPESRSRRSRKRWVVDDGDDTVDVGARWTRPEPSRFIRHLNLGIPYPKPVWLAQGASDARLESRVMHRGVE